MLFIDSLAFMSKSCPIISTLSITYALNLLRSPWPSLSYGYADPANSVGGVTMGFWVGLKMPSGFDGWLAPYGEA